MHYAINGSKLGQFSVLQTGHFHLNYYHRLMGYTCDCVKDYTMLYVVNGSQLEILSPCNISHMRLLVALSQYVTFSSQVEQ